MIAQSAFFLALLYACFALFLAYGIFRLRRRGSRPGLPMVSVIIAARNEEKNIGACLLAAAGQDYPPDKFEVIAVNDRSTDGTSAILQEHARKYGNLRILDITETPAGIGPKKYALGRGIETAAGDIILTTDADCRPGKCWIRTVVSHFGDETGLVAGYSPLHPSGPDRGFSRAFIAVDALALAVMAAGTIGAGWGTTCSGRNLAFRKKAFDEIGGYSQIASYVSGDDDLFLHLIRTRSRWGLGYAVEPEAAVPGLICAGLGTFVNQRKRHASKFRAYPADIRIFGALMYLVNAGFVLSIAGIAACPGQIAAAAAAVMVKLAADLLVIFIGARVFKTAINLLYLPAVLLAHPFYVVLFGILGIRGKFRWKDTSFTSELRA